MKIYALNINELIYQFREGEPIEQSVMSLIKERMGEVEFNEILRQRELREQERLLENPEKGKGNEIVIDKGAVDEKGVVRDGLVIDYNANYSTKRFLINKYSREHYGKDIIEKVLSLFRKFISAYKISNLLQIPFSVTDSILQYNMNRGIEYWPLRREIARREKDEWNKRKPAKPVSRPSPSNLGGLIWNAYYLQKKSKEQVMAELNISYDTLAHVLDIINKSLNKS